MIHELIYTSAPAGLRRGSTGYCTVAHTKGLSAELVERLEGFSRYRHRVIGDDPARSRNPVVHCHTIVEMGF